MPTKKFIKVKISVEIIDIFVRIIDDIISFPKINIIMTFLNVSNQEPKC